MLDILLLESLTYMKKRLVLLRKILVSGQYWLANCSKESPDSINVSSGFLGVQNCLNRRMKESDLLFSSL